VKEKEGKCKREVGRIWWGRTAEMRRGKDRGRERYGGKMVEESKREKVWGVAGGSESWMKEGA